MTLSDFNLENLASKICGWSIYLPLLTGRLTVDFFNNYGFNDIYDRNEIKSRFTYAEQKLKALNGTKVLTKLIEEFLDPKRFLELGGDVEEAVEDLNKYLKYDHYELVKVGNYYKVSSLQGSIIEPTSLRRLNHEFINEQIVKCLTKIKIGDYKGAITNARSLIESLFIEIIESETSEPFKNDGNIENLWKKAKKLIKAEFEQNANSDFVIQTLSGLNTSLNGLAALSNNAADRHANRFETQRHHAKLAVNVSMTLAEYIVDCWIEKKSSFSTVDGNIKEI